jgi:hypothetical protein
MDPCICWWIRVVVDAGPHGAYFVALASIFHLLHPTSSIHLHSAYNKIKPLICFAFPAISQYGPKFNAFMNIELIQITTKTSLQWCL